MWKKQHKQKGFLTRLTKSQNENQLSFKPLCQFSILNPKLTEGRTEMLLLQPSVGSKGLGAFILSHLLEKKKHILV